MIDSFAEEGSAGRHVRAIIGRLSRRRFDVRLVTLFDSEPPPSELEMTKIDSHHLALTLDDGVQAMADRLGEVVCDAEIVHAHSLSSGMAANLAVSGGPVVTTVHQLPGHSGACLPPDVREDRIGSALTDGRGARRVLATTRAIRRRLEELGVVDVAVVPPFVDVTLLRERFRSFDRASARRQWSVHQGDVALLHVGEVRRENRQIELLEAYRVALRELPSMRLFLAGNGPGLPDARALAEELALGDSMSFLAAPGDLLGVHRAADIFVLPAWSGAFPWALLDAMTTGLPSVVGGDEPELDPVGSSAGLRSVPGRVEHMAKQILTLAFDPHVRAEMGRAAAERAARFDVGRWIPRLERMYSEL